MSRSNIELENLPGFHIRRLQQIAVAVFLEETQAFGVTPVQYAAMAAIQRQPGVDQRTLARSIGFDAATIGSVIDRLEVRGLMQRQANPNDRRARLLTLTPDGTQLLRKIEPSMLRAQARMLEPLPAGQRGLFMAMLRQLVEGNNDLSRAPSGAAASPATEVTREGTQATRKKPSNTAPRTAPRKTGRTAVRAP
ncbi:MAG: MarR family transcriptional regulator [Burkholderiales bacterium]|nr:MarR family transcriptional regulator [Burkholderiales bacterium]